MSEYTSNPNSLTGGPFGTTAATTNTGFFTDKTNPSSVNCNALPEPSNGRVANADAIVVIKNTPKEGRENHVVVVIVLADTAEQPTMFPIRRHMPRALSFHTDYPLWRCLLLIGN